MTKPDDVPQDVWNAALRTVLVHPQALGIARAIMAAKAEEREACANIADSKISGGYYDGAPVWADGNEIASAIRKRGEAD